MKFVGSKIMASMIIIACILHLSICVPKLPMYIGHGYDILRGNPLSGEGVDPGFQHEIF